MLGRLIQGYARGNQLESTTDETHTRTLLWPEPQSDPRSASVSPPTTPFGSPIVRVSPFDDRAGLELSGKRDLRLVIAQDAFGTNDRPLLLFDTQPAEHAQPARVEKQNTSSPPTGHNNRANHPGPMLGHVRNRSSTISGSSTSWTRSSKDSETTDHLSNALDCMFGVSSATKSGSSTKLHFIPGDRSSVSDLSQHAPSSNMPAIASSRTPLSRSRTAIHLSHTQTSQSSMLGMEAESRDAILVTRVFPVALSDSRDNASHHRTSSAGQSTSPVGAVGSGEQQAGSASQSKKPKLVEKKIPMFAIGLLCYLPRPGDGRPSTSSARPSSRASFVPSSMPNSQGSGSFSSWTFLNAVPEHLWTDETSTYSTDKGIEVIVKNWDIILRSLTVVETMARTEIGELLQEVNFALISSAAKAPKGPFEQRTNQRNVYLRTSNRLMLMTDLQHAANHALWRIAYALRVPRVSTGLGLENGGHWLDEARYLVRLCGTKQQNFFLFNLLTAFLGNHTQWLERFGPDWYRKQYRAMNKGKPSSSNLASRTIIICDNRSMARRIIFLLASFLPRNSIVKSGNDFLSPLVTPEIGTSSPANSIRRNNDSKTRSGTLSFARRDISGLSTSISSSGSVSAISKAIQGGSRTELESGQIQHTSNFNPTDALEHAQKTNATSSTVTPGTGTPVPHFATGTDSYFPVAATVDGDESGASADLARILRRDSTNHAQLRPPSINWGSLVNNVSGLWNKRQDSTSSTSEVLEGSTTGSLTERRKPSPKSMSTHNRKPSHLEKMVDEAIHVSQGVTSSSVNDHQILGHSSIAPPEVHPPHLTVDVKDGVVDVDLNIPGFISWNESVISSPPSSVHYRSPSYTSTDEAASSYTSRSFGVDGASSSLGNVAGYLKRYHEDFILQGVKAYPELQDEVKQSMSRECTPPPGVRDTKVRGQEKEWTNVCTSLLADFRNFTIHRLTLQRSLGDSSEVAVDDPQQVGTVEPSGSTASKASTEHPSRTNSQTREQFVLETVMDFDTTLTDAIERVLNETDVVRHKSVAASRTHSRNVSTSTTASVKSLPLTITGAGKNRAWQPTSNLAQADCRQAVVGALENVVKSVNDDLTKHHRNRGADGQVRVDGAALKQDMKQDNVLRAGVKKWLLHVETKSVW